MKKPKKIVVLEVGKPAEVREVVLTLENMQALVGGLITCVHIGRGIDMWANDDGLALGLPHNPGASKFYTPGIVGNVFFASTNTRGDTIALSAEKIAWLMVMLP